MREGEEGRGMREGVGEGLTMREERDAIERGWRGGYRDMTEGEGVGEGRHMREGGYEVAMHDGTRNVRETARRHEGLDVCEAVNKLRVPTRALTAMPRETCISKLFF